MCGVLAVKINEAELNEPNAAADPRQEKLIQQEVLNVLTCGSG